MPALEDFAEQRLAIIKAEHRYRQLQESFPVDGIVLNHNGKEFVSFSGNDYLGLSQHPQVKEAALEAIYHYGAGAGASRFVTGNHPLYSDVEKKLAALKGTESACIAGSGYLANIGVIPALIGKNDLILADRLVHACLLDGAKIAGAALMRFPHNNVENCEALLQQYRSRYTHCLIMTETVFSMDGDKAPLEALSQLAKKYDCWLLTDDAHGLGVVKQKNNADIQMGTLSKAVGSYGGYIAGKAAVIDYIRNSARSLIFSTALPPAVLAAAGAALDIIREDTILSAKVLQNAQLFTLRLGLQAAESAIVPLILGEADVALSASAKLAEEGVLVKAIRPPTVPPGTSRLRFTFSALHEQNEIERLVKVIKRCLKVEWGNALS